MNFSSARFLNSHPRPPPLPLEVKMRVFFVYRVIVFDWRRNINSRAIWKFPWKIKCQIKQCSLFIHILNLNSFYLDLMSRNKMMHSKQMNGQNVIRTTFMYSQSVAIATMVISFQMWFESLWWCTLDSIRSNARTFVRNSCHVINIKHKNHTRRFRANEKRTELCIASTLWTGTPVPLNDVSGCVCNSDEYFPVLICIQRKYV